MVIVSVCVLGCTGCSDSAISPSPPAPRNVTLTFNGLTVDGAPVTIYSESGFSISASTGSWVVKTTYGNPAPFIQFRASAPTAVTGQIQVSADGHRSFSFTSVDLYSSTTPIPYAITGVRDSVIAFTLADTLPNTFGNFRTVVNPRGTDVIDTLTISLTNASAPCCPNPMGLDTIVLSQ
jgi:hypothetical protein